MERKNSSSSEGKKKECEWIKKNGFKCRKPSLIGGRCNQHLYKMPEIKFSNNYPKLWNQETAELIAIKKLEGRKLHKDLIEYDTKQVDGSYYHLYQDELIQLIFIGDKGIPFCTLRRYIDSKWKYYEKLVGEEFNVVIKNV